MADSGKTKGEPAQGEHIFLTVNMSKQTEYFILVGILFAGYVCMRVWVVWYAQNLPKAPEEPEGSDGPEGKGIEIQELSDRIQRVREEWHEDKPATQTNSFKRELLVESKREQMAKMSFFQNPPPPLPELHDEERGFHLLMA